MSSGETRRRSTRRSSLSQPSVTPSQASRAEQDVQTTNDSVVGAPSTIMPPPPPPPSQTPPIPSTSFPAVADTRQPVTRLNSLSRRVPGSPATPPIGELKNKPLKFKPKAVIRRSQEERERDERAEQARIAARDVALNTAAIPARGGAFVRGRGALRAGFQPLRGGHGTRVAEGVASGPFGAAAPSSSEKKSNTIAGSSQSSSSRSSVRAKRKPAASKDKAGDTAMSDDPRIKAEVHDPTVISSDEDDEDQGPRVNISEFINLISDDEDEEGKKRMVDKSNWRLRPLRLGRKEHQERAVGVNTEASSTKTADMKRRTIEEGEDEHDSTGHQRDPAAETVGREVKDKEVQFLSGRRKLRGVYQDDDPVRVKPEPGTTSDAMDIDGKQAKAVQPKAKTSISVAHEESSTQDEKAETDEPRLIRRHKVSTKDAKPVLQTEEDRQESNRHQRDVKLLSEELGQIHTSGQPTSRVDSEGDSSMDHDGREPGPRDGALYLFQFPPILPALYDPVKQEGASESPPVVLVDGPPPIPSPPSKLKSAARAAPGPAVEPVVKEQESDGPLKSAAITAKDAHLPSGKAGTLRVHASGKVKLSWGGASLELSRGIETDFLQDVVLADLRNCGTDDTPSGDTGGRGVGYCISTLKSKFVLSPAWEDLLQ